jgi:hypothetical protein
LKNKSIGLMIEEKRRSKREERGDFWPEKAKWG